MRVLSAAVFIACTTAALLVAGCGAFRPTVRGSGVVATESRDVAGFNSIDLGGFGTVHVEQTGAESLTIEAEDNLLPMLETRVENGRLKLTTKPDVNIHATRPVVYRITVDRLEAVTVSGSGKIHAPRLQTPRLTARVSGSGDVRVEELDAEVAGSGSVRYHGKPQVNTHISGSGSVRRASGG